MKCRYWILLMFLALTSMIGGRAQAQEKTEIVLWHAYRAEERKALEQVVQTYNTSHDKIKITLLPVPYDAFPDKISAAIPRGKGPDLFIFAHDRIGDWAESKVIEPIDFWMDDKLESQFIAKTLTPLYYRKSIYALPIAFKSPVLFYNKDKVKTPPKTTDELIATAKKLTDKSKKVYGLVYENANFYFQSAWMHAFGGRVFNEKGRPELTSDSVVKSFQFAQDLRMKHGIMPEEISSVLVTSLFNEGKAAMVINGPWFRGELKSGLNYGVAVLPTVSATGKPAMPFMGSEGVLMSAKSKHKEEAFEVMTYLVGLESAKIRMSVGKQTVATAAAYEGASDPMIKIFRAQLDNSIPMPNTPQMLMVWSPATTAINKVVNGGGDPAEALKIAQGQIENAIDTARR